MEFENALEMDTLFEQYASHVIAPRAVSSSWWAGRSPSRSRQCCTCDPRRRRRSLRPRSRLCRTRYNTEDMHKTNQTLSCSTKRETCFQFKWLYGLAVRVSERYTTSFACCMQVDCAAWMPTLVSSKRTEKNAFKSLVCKVVLFPRPVDEWRNLFSWVLCHGLGFSAIHVEQLWRTRHNTEDMHKTNQTLLRLLAVHYCVCLRYVSRLRCLNAHLSKFKRKDREKCIQVPGMQSGSVPSRTSK